MVITSPKEWSLRTSKGQRIGYNEQRHLKRICFEKSVKGNIRVVFKTEPGAAYFCFYRNAVMTIYYPVLLNPLKSFRLKYSGTQSWLMKNWH